MSNIITEHRRSTMYNHVTTVAAREAAKAPRSPVAELRARQADERRELGQRHRVESVKLRHTHTVEQSREHGRGAPHGAPKLDERQQREQRAMEQRQADERTAMAVGTGQR
jgi:hypothetical protein